MAVVVEGEDQRTTLGSSFKQACRAMRRPCRSPDPPSLELLISFTIASARAADAKRVGTGIVVLVRFLSYEFSDLKHSSDYMGTPLTS